MTAYSEILQANGLSSLSKGDLPVYSPIDGDLLGRLPQDKPQTAGRAVQKSQKAFQAWRAVPPPVRGELVRLLGEELRAAKEDLGALVTIESGKILSEGLGKCRR